MTFIPLPPPTAPFSDLILANTLRDIFSVLDLEFLYRLHHRLKRRNLTHSAAVVLSEIHNREANGNE